VDDSIREIIEDLEITAEDVRDNGYISQQDVAGLLLYYRDRLKALEIQALKTTV
jgi:hypothetical protein